jgi:GAF domain-containing protein
VADFPLGPNEKERLRVLHASGLMDDLVVPELDSLCAEAAKHFEVKTAIVTLLGVDLQIFKAKFGVDGASTPRNLAFCNFTILSDNVFVVSDALIDERFADNPLVTGPPFIRFYAGAPLIFQHEVRLGALCLVDPVPRAFSLGDRAELQEMAGRATDAISNAWFALDLHS